MGYFLSKASIILNQPLSKVSAMSPHEVRSSRPVGKRKPLGPEVLENQSYRFLSVCSQMCPCQVPGPMPSLSQPDFGVRGTGGVKSITLFLHYTPPTDLGLPSGHRLQRSLSTAIEAIQLPHKLAVLSPSFSSSALLAFSNNQPTPWFHSDHFCHIAQLLEMLHQSGQPPSV